MTIRRPPDISAPSQVAVMMGTSFTRKAAETVRHRTVWIETGPEQGPLMIFLLSSDWSGAGRCNTSRIGAGGT
jgi:hypothetical protein